MEKFLITLLRFFKPPKNNKSNKKNKKEKSFVEVVKHVSSSSEFEIIEDIVIEKVPISQEMFELAYANGTKLRDGSKLLLYENYKYKNLEIQETNKAGLYKVKLPTNGDLYQYTGEAELLGQIPCIAGTIKRINDNEYRYVRYYYDDALADTTNSLMSVAKVFNKDEIINFINSQGLVF